MGIFPGRVRMKATAVACSPLASLGLTYNSFLIPWEAHRLDYRVASHKFGQPARGDVTSVSSFGGPFLLGGFGK